MCGNIIQSTIELSDIQVVEMVRIFQIVESLNRLIVEPIRLWRTLPNHQINLFISNTASIQLLSGGCQSLLYTKKLFPNPVWEGNGL